jgi:hypothetical protein
VLTIGAVYSCFAYALGIWPANGAFRQAGYQATTPERVVITRPAAGQRVPHAVTAQGTAERIDDDITPWLIVKAGRSYYPQGKIPSPVSGTGTWSERVFFGSANGSADHEYVLYVVAADSATNDQFESYVRRRAARGKVRALSDYDGTYPNPLSTIPSTSSASPKRRIRTFQAGEFSQRVDAPIAQFCSLVAGLSIARRVP